MHLLRGGHHHHHQRDSLLYREEVWSGSNWWCNVLSGRNIVHSGRVVGRSVSCQRKQGSLFLFLLQHFPPLYRFMYCIYYSFHLLTVINSTKKGPSLFIRIPPAGSLFSHIVIGFISNSSIRGEHMKRGVWWHAFSSFVYFVYCKSIKSPFLFFISKWSYCHAVKLVENFSLLEREIGWIDCDGKKE